MRTQDQIQSDLRELRRQYEALEVAGKKHSGKHVSDDSRSIKLRADLLKKINECSQEYMAAIKASQY